MTSPFSPAHICPVSVLYASPVERPSMYSGFFLFSCGDRDCATRTNGICISDESKAAPSPAMPKMSSITSLDRAVWLAFATAVVMIISSGYQQR